MPEAITLVPGLTDVAVKREPVRQCLRHLALWHTRDHSPKSRLMVIARALVFVRAAERMEEERSADPPEGLKFDEHNQHGAVRPAAIRPTRLCSFSGSTRSGETHCR